ERERIHQIEIEIDEVLRTIEVIRDRRSGEARMGRFDQLEAFGETIGERITENRAAAAVQEQHARAAALPLHLKIDPLQPVARCREIGHRVLPGTPAARRNIISLSPEVSGLYSLRTRPRTVKARPEGCMCGKTATMRNRHLGLSARLGCLLLGGLAAVGS